MPLMSLTAYAATHGVKKQSAAEWKTRGFLVMNGALVDADASDAKMKAGAKGRFRVKAHGGRRQAGVRGAIDRPGMGYVGGAMVPEALLEVGTPRSAWAEWSPLENPHRFADEIREAFEGGDDEEIADVLDLVSFGAWEDASTAAGWNKWPATAAAGLATELGIADAGAVEAALQRQVTERLATLGWSADDLADPRLEPR